MDRGGLWGVPLLLLLLLVIMSGAAAYELENVAKGATGAYQSSNTWNEVSMVADGDDRTCSPNWEQVWRIDLHRDTDLTWIRVHITAEMSKHVPTVITPGCRSGANTLIQGSTLDWVCEGRTNTRYILLRFINYVYLCEVFVYRGSVINVARGRPARQSTTFDGTDRDVTPPLTFRGDAGLAVDGAPTHVYQEKTCAVTDWNNDKRCTETPWWTVEFAAPVPVLAVTVVGRGDNVANFGPLVASIGQREIGLHNSSTIPTHVFFPLLPPITSPSLRLSIPRCSVLQLCEVEAYTLKACLYDVTWGENCTKTCPTTCLKNRCHPVTGTCLDGCVAGYTGDTCETDIDECSSAPCSNGALCTQGVGSFSCACLPGYSGLQCDININECLSNPCRNGGRCVDLVDSFSCTCLPGYIGVLCETDVNECLSGPCINGGTCEDRTNAYTCTCPPGYVGKNCETNYDECRGYPCRNGGQCTDGINSFTCNCSEGFMGPRCEIDVDECISLPCKNGGSCSDRRAGYYCSCLIGFSGSQCELAMDQCQSSPCLNGGDCINHVTSFTCTCTPGFSGRRCEIREDLRQCASNPCPANSRCINDGGSYVCICPPGTSGSHCYSVGGDAAGGDGTGTGGTGGDGTGKGVATAVQGSGTALFTALLLAAVCLV